jgi:hypothetical protein
MAEFRKLDLSCIESTGKFRTSGIQKIMMHQPLFDLYSMIVDWGRFNTLRKVTL